MDLPAPTDIDHRMTARLQRPRPLGQSRRKRPAEFAHQGAVPGGDRLAVGTAADAAAGHGANIAGHDRLEAPRRGRHGDGARQAHARNGAPVRRPGQAPRRSPTPSLSMPTTRGLPEVSVPVLSKASNRVRARASRARRVADQAAAARQPPDAERGRERRGEAHRAGTGNHQHREANQQRPVERHRAAPNKRPSARRARERTGTETPTTRSAMRWVGLRRDSASRTDRQICAQRVADPGAAALDQQRSVEIDAAGDHRRSRRPWRLAGSPR